MRVTFKIIVLVLGLFCTINSFANERLSSKEYLDVLRDTFKRNNGSTYAILEGNLLHARRDSDEIIELPLYMGVLISPEKSITQIILNGEEGYIVGRNIDSSSVTPMHNIGTNFKHPLGNFGVNPSDLAMDFVGFEFVKELESESIKLMKCRVFILKNPENSELVKAYIAERYFFAMKAEFFANQADLDNNNPNRILEVNSFKRQNGLYYVEKIILSGSGWKTVIEFDEANVDFYDKNKQLNVFKQLTK